MVPSVHPQVCLDCSFEDKMTFKEINSLALQIRYCYAANRRAKFPVHFSASSLAGQTHDLLGKVCGFPEQWKTRAFTCSEQSVEEMHATERDSLVYLTSDSDHTLQKLEKGKIYVIGGIVDRNRLKRVAIDKAEALGITTARLPIDEHLKVGSTKVLTCNHVFEILLQCRATNNDWKKAMLEVLPQRKEIEEIGAGQDTEKAAELEENEPETPSDEQEVTPTTKETGENADVVA